MRVQQAGSWNDLSSRSERRLYQPWTRTEHSVSVSWTGNDGERKATRSRQRAFNRKGRKEKAAKVAKENTTFDLRVH